jgi:hypothetical protein
VEHFTVKLLLKMVTSQTDKLTNLLNMKKIQLLVACLGLVAVTSLSAQPIFSEDFNGATPLSNWTLINNDGLTPNAAVAVVNDAWVVLAGTGGDNYAASTSWYTPAGVSDDYMITPSITLTASNYLFFDERAPDANFRDDYEVLISTTTPTITGLTANPVLYTTTSPATTFSNIAIDLSSYAGQTVYLGWRNKANDEYLLFINNVEVKPVLANDAQVVEVNVSGSYSTGSTVTISGVLENTGLTNLTSVDLNWSADGGVTVNTNSLTLNTPSFTTVNFAHTVTLAAANPGNFTDFKVWTSLPNAVPDSNSVNDTISDQFFVNNGTSQTRNVLLEEFTTAPCQFCPDGAVVVEQILASNPAVIAVGEHACFGTDAMTIPEAVTYCTDFGSGAPTACVDRVQFPGESSVAHGRGTWQANATSQAAVTSPVDVTLTGSYDATSRLTIVNVNADFVDFAIPGDLRLTLFVVEDSVTGTGSTYDQVNAYNTQAGHPYAGAGNPIVGFVHKHVLRDVYPTNDAWGVANVIATNPAPNSTYNTSYTFTMSSVWKDKDISLVGFVSYYNANTAQREVLNSVEVKLTNLVTSISEIKKDVNSLNIYPNPTADIANVVFDLSKSAPVSLIVRDITGKEVMSNNFGVLNTGFQRITINAESLSNGIYFATVQIGKELVTRKISVNK